MSTEKIIPGKNTSEYAETQSAKAWGIVAMILGFIMASGSEILVAVSVTSDSKFGIIGGVVIMVCGQMYRGFVQLGYIKSRDDVKVAAEQAKAGNDE